MKIVLLGLTLSATCNAFFVAPPAAFRRSLTPLHMAEAEKVTVIEVTEKAKEVVAETPKPKIEEEAAKTMTEVKKESPPEAPKVEAKVEAPKVEEKLVAKESPIVDKPAPETPKVEAKAVEEKLVAKETPPAAEKPAPEKVVAKDTTTTTADKPEPKMEEKVIAKDTTPAVEKSAPEVPKVEDTLVAKEPTPTLEKPTEAPKLVEEKLVSAKAPEGKDGPLTVDHAVAKASNEPLQIQTGAAKTTAVESQEVAAKATEKATNEVPIPSEISDALKSVDNIKLSIAQAKTDMEAGIIGKTAYIEKLEDYTSQLNQIDQKMQGVITARSSDIEKLNLMLSKLEEQGGVVGQKALSKIGDMAMDVASSGVFDFF